MVMLPKETVSINDISVALGKTRQAIDKQSKKENWKRSKSGNKFTYRLSDLPLDIQQACYEKTGIVALGSSLPVATHSSLIPEYHNDKSLSCHRNQQIIMD